MNFRSVLPAVSAHDPLNIYILCNRESLKIQFSIQSLTFLRFWPIPQCIHIYTFQRTMADLWPACYVGQFTMFNQEVVNFMYLPDSHEACGDLCAKMGW